MTGQTLGDWVHRYNEEGVEGLRDRPRPVAPARSTRGSRPPSRRWCCGARAWSAVAALPGAPATCAPWSRRGSGCATTRAGCSSSSRASTCRGRRPGRSTPRPTRRRRSGAKNLPDPLRGVADRHPEAAWVELWFMDEARIGQKGRTAHVWCQKGFGRAACAGRGSPPPTCSARFAPSAARGCPGPAWGLDRRHGRVPGRTGPRRAGWDPRRARARRGRLAHQRGSEPCRPS